MGLPLQIEQQGRLVIRAAPTNGSNLWGRLTHQPSPMFLGRLNHQPPLQITLTIYSMHSRKISSLLFPSPLSLFSTLSPSPDVSSGQGDGGWRERASRHHSRPPLPPRLSPLVPPPPLRRRGAATAAPAKSPVQQVVGGRPWLRGPQRLPSPSTAPTGGRRLGCPRCDISSAP